MKFKSEKEFQNWLTNEIEKSTGLFVQKEKTCLPTKYIADIWIPDLKIVIECKQSLEYKHIRKQKYKHLPQLKLYADLLKANRYFLAYANEAEKIRDLIIKECIEYYL